MRIRWIGILIVAAREAARAARQKLARVAAARKELPYKIAKYDPEKDSYKFLGSHETRIAALRAARDNPEATHVVQTHTEGGEPEWRNPAERPFGTLAGGYLGGRIGAAAGGLPGAIGGAVIGGLAAEAAYSMRPSLEPPGRALKPPKVWPKSAIESPYD